MWGGWLRRKAEPALDDEAIGEVVAMQFAGGLSIAKLAADWDRDREWVEQAIRHALLASIPKRDGGLKPSRWETRPERREELDMGQGELELF